MSILKVLKSLDIDYVCSKNIIKYVEENGEMKKARPPIQNIFGITGSKKHNTYPITHDDTYGEYGYCVLYTGKLYDEDGVIIGIDIDDYSNRPVKDKLEDLGFDWDKCKNYKWITKSAKNGIHIICKWSANTDITTTNLYHQGKDSCIDMRGTGGKLILAGSKSTIGNYEWIHGEPTTEDQLLFIKTINISLYKSIETYSNNRTAGLRKDKDKQKELKKIEKKDTPNIKYIDNPNDADLELFRVMLSKLDMNVELYGLWCKIGMCLHNEFGGNELGLNLFKEFSTLSNKYDEYYTDNIWEYWTTYDIRNRYPYLNKRIILRELITKTNDTNIFNVCRKIAKDNIKQNNMDNDSIDSSSSNNTEDIFLSELYTEYKKRFEENEGVFRVDDTFRRLRVSMNAEVKLETLDENKLSKAYKNHPKIPYIVEGKTKWKSFIQTWIQDPNAKSYYGCAFKPNQPRDYYIKLNGKDYHYSNEFYGFRGDNKPDGFNPTQEQKDFMIQTFLTQLKMLCENNDTILTYHLHFIRKMLLYTEQKSMNVMTCFISDYTGLGKNSMVEFLFNKVIGNQYAKISDKLDKVFGTFSQFRHNKVAFCYNEGELSMTMNKFNQLKALITDIDDDYEAKYCGSIDSENLLHCWFLSNDLVSLKITETDRRHLVCFGIPIEPKEDFDKQVNNWYKCLKDDDFGYVIYDYLTNDNSWVDEVMGNRYYDFGHNIPLTKAKASIIETFTPVEIQFLKYLIESNFRPMENTMKQIAHPSLLQKYYMSVNCEWALEYDYKLKELQNGNIKCKSYDNIEDRYTDSLSIIEEIVDNAQFLETFIPYYQIISKTNLRNEHNIKKKCSILTHNYLQMLSINTEFMDHYKTISNEYSTHDVKLDVNRNKDINNYVRIEMSYFIWKMNDYRQKSNSSNSKKQMNSILNQFRIVFNRTTNNSLMKIKTINGKKYISFHKKEVLDRINEKYVFTED
jgi:hypothetical protein